MTSLLYFEKNLGTKLPVSVCGTFGYLIDAT